MANFPEPADPDPAKGLGASPWSTSGPESVLRVPRPGTLVAGLYEVQEKIDPETCLARDIKHGRNVVVRSAVWRNQNLAELWQREVRRLVDLRSAHFLNIYGVYTENGTDYVVSDVPPGPSLRDLLRDRPALTLAEVMSIMAPIADALDVAAGFTRFWSSISTRALFLQTADSSGHDLRTMPISDWSALGVKLDLWMLLHPNNVPPAPSSAVSGETKASQAVQQAALLVHELLGGRKRSEAERRRKYRPVTALNGAANSILYSGVQGWPLFENAASFLKDLELAAQPAQSAEEAVKVPGAVARGGDFARDTNGRTRRAVLVPWFWLSSAVLAFLIVAGLFFLPPQRKPAPVTPSVPPKQPAMFSLRSEPTGAVIHLDGTELGKTPVVGHALAPGTHLLSVDYPGYQTREIQVDLAAGQSEDLGTIVLQKPGGELSLNTDPPGTPFELIGPQEQRLTGVTPSTFQQLEPGSYTVNLRPPGRPEHTENVEVSLGQLVRVTHDFAVPEKEAASAENVAPTTPAQTSTPAEPAPTQGAVQRPKVLPREKSLSASIHKKTALSKETAFRRFNAEWDAKEQSFDRQIDAVDRKLSNATGIQKKQLAAYKKYLQHRKNATRDLRKYRELALKRQYNEPESGSVLDSIKNIFSR
jgi:PEGA domain